MYFRLMGMLTAFGSLAFASPTAMRCYADAPPEVAWRRVVDTIEDDAVLGVAVDGDDNVYVTGFTESDLAATNVGRSDVFISKYTAFGSELWTRQYGSSSFDDGADVAWDGGTTIYVAGDWQQWTYHLTRVDLDGNVLWTKQPIDLAGQENLVGKLAIAGDGSVYTASVYGPLIKHNENGEPDWTVNLRGGQGLAVDSQNVYVTGATEESGYAAQVSPSGETLWTAQFTGQGNAAAYSTHDDSLYVGGRAGSMALLRKYDSDGSLTWMREFAGVGGETQFAEINDVAIDSNGNVYVTGHTYGDLEHMNEGYADVFLRKYDPIGNVIWTWQYGDEFQNYGMSIAIGSGDRIFLGVTHNTSGPQHGEVIAFVPEPPAMTLCLMAACAALASWSRRTSRAK